MLLRNYQLLLRPQVNRKFKIIIIDNYSTDKTTEIAKQYTNQIYSYKNPGNQDKGYYKLFADASI